MPRNALGRGLGALIREPEPQVPTPGDLLRGLHRILPVCLQREVPRLQPRRR